MAQTLGELRDKAKENNYKNRAIMEAIQNNNKTYEALRKIVHDNQVTKEVFKRQNEIQKLSNSLRLKPYQNENFIKPMQHLKTYSSIYSQMKPIFNTNISIKPQLTEIIKIQKAISPLTDFRFNTRINDILKQTKYQYDFSKFNKTLYDKNFQKQLKSISTINNMNIDLAIKQMQRVIGEMQEEANSTEDSVPTKDNEFIYNLIEYVLKCYDTAQVISDINNSNVNIESFLNTFLFVIGMILPYAKKINEDKNKKV